MSSKIPNELKAIAHATAAAVKAVDQSTDVLPVMKSIFGAIDWVITTIRVSVGCNHESVVIDPIFCFSNFDRIEMTGSVSQGSSCSSMKA